MRIGTPRLQIFSLASLAVLGLLAANGCPPQTIQETKLLASDGTADDYFGFSVSMSGDVVVVSASRDHINSIFGWAYVFHHDGVSWSDGQKLTASDGAVYDRFGSSVSVSGDVAVVGARGDDDNGDWSGSAYVFRYDGASWVEETKLLPSDGATGDFFGSSVSISGDAAVVGAWGGDDNGLDSGSAYVYRFDGTTWVKEAKLLASNGAAYDWLGTSVSISGDVAVVGARDDDDNGLDSGSAYVYRFNGTNWVEEAKLLASEGAAGDHFGNWVSISGDVAVVGAFWDDDNGDRSGSAYVYRWNGSSWVEEQKLLASDGARDDLFGTSVSVSGDVAVVGAHADDDNGSASGSAYVYRWNGSSWVEDAKLLASDGATGDFFGSSVSISGEAAVVGAWGGDDNGSYSGSAYVFSSLGSTPACSDALDNDGDGEVDLDDPGCSVPLDTSEHSGRLLCDDGLDNDGDGLVDFPDDPDCGSQWTPGESGCSDGRDNDGDGLADFPDDPGCEDLEDSSETSLDLVCDDGVDNDADGLIDFPDDPGCDDLQDSSEASAGLLCDDGLDNDGDGLVDFPDDPDCGSPEAPGESGCSDGRDNDGDGLADFPDDPGCEDLEDSSETSPDLVCDDGLDGDGDGHVDFPDDPGCEDPTDSSETSAGLACDDGLDNDGDGLIDFPDDPDCTSSTDPAEEPDCSDGLDNDGDGLVDHPEDPGCRDTEWRLEDPQCDDDFDNDADGKIDWDGGVGGGTPDPGCITATWGKLELQLHPGDILAAYPESIVRIDPVAGDPQVVLSVESGRSFADLAIGPTGDLFVTDSDNSPSSPFDDGKVLRLDLETGLVSTVAEGLEIGLCGWFGYGCLGGGIAVERDGSLLVPTVGALLRIDPATGGQSVLATYSALLADVAIDAGGDIFLVSGAPGIYRVDPETGDLTLAFEVDLENPYGSRLIISTTGDFFVNSSSAILRIDPDTGAQETYASTGLDQFGDIAEEPDGSLLAVKFSEHCGKEHCSLLGSQLARVPSGDVIPDTDVSHETRSIAVVRPACTDQLDNDGDSLIDYPNDPGCIDPASILENPQCQDGIDNDGDGQIDFDGGASAGLPSEQQADPDPQCSDAWQIREASCGLGAELALLLPMIFLWRRRGRDVPDPLGGWPSPRHPCSRDHRGS